jgi:hypothetical protein
MPLYIEPTTNVYTIIKINDFFTDKCYKKILKQKCKKRLNSNYL